MLRSLELYLLILIEGFITISVEILALRQLVPIVGSNVIVTSIIIGIFLLFLAIGYLRGGRVQKNLLGVLSRNFFLANLFVGFGLSANFIEVYFGYADKLVSWVLLSLTLYLLMILAPVVYWLGQTLPILTNYFKKSSHVGAVSGKALYLSTIGSFLGSVGTSLVLFNFLGVGWTVVVNCVLLILLMCVMLDKQWHSWLLVLIGASTIYSIYDLNVGYERTRFVSVNSYANYEVIKDANLITGSKGNALFINNSFSSFITDDLKGVSYIESLKQILFRDLKITNEDILVLGAGGFTLSAESTFGNHFTYVDIDPEILDIVKTHFLDKIQGEFIGEDARSYLKQTKKKYGVILSDVYSHKAFIPSHLLTVEFFKDLKMALKDDGWAVFNMIISPLLDDEFSKRVDNTISHVFPTCLKIPVYFRKPRSNVLFLCPKTSLDDKVVYVDNINSATLDNM